LALRLGRDGRIVSPPELADSARHAAREALAAYDGIEAVAAADVVEAADVRGPHAVADGPDGRRA
jgi:proteasome accessory factor C